MAGAFCVFGFSFRRALVCLYPPTREKGDIGVTWIKKVLLLMMYHVDTMNDLFVQARRRKKHESTVIKGHPCDS